MRTLSKGQSKSSPPASREKFLLESRSFRSSPAGEVDVKVTQAEQFPLPGSQGSPPHQATALIHLHLPSSSSSPPPRPYSRSLVEKSGVPRHRPGLLPPHTTVLIRLTGFDLGAPPCPAPGGCGESGVADGGGNGE